MDTFDFSAERVCAFVKRQMSFNEVDGMQGIGLVRDGEMVAGVIFEGNNGHNVWMHVAAKPGARWLTRAYMAACFGYAFVQCGVKRVSGYVEASNTAARRFDEHIGFKQEAVLQGAASDGGDVLIYRMTRAECKYVDPQ